MLAFRAVEDDRALRVLLDVAGADHLADQARRGLAVHGLLLEVLDLVAEGGQLLERLPRVLFLADRFLLVLGDLLLRPAAFAADHEHVRGDALGDYRDD